MKYQNDGGFTPIISGKLADGRTYEVAQNAVADCARFIAVDEAGKRLTKCEVIIRDMPWVEDFVWEQHVCEILGTMIEAEEAAKPRSGRSRG